MGIPAAPPPELKQIRGRREATPGSTHKKRVESKRRAAIAFGSTTGFTVAPGTASARRGRGRRGESVCCPLARSDPSLWLQACRGERGRVKRQLPEVLGCCSLGLVGRWSTAKSVGVFWHQNSCTFGPDGTEVNQRKKKSARMPKVPYRVILW